MSKIAIVSNEKLHFPPVYQGYVEMNIEVIQNKPEQEIYELRIVDTCFDWIEEDYQEPIITPPIEEGGKPVIEFETRTRRIKKIFAQSVRPLKVFTYDELANLAKLISLKRVDFESDTEFINELFRRGFLLMTKQECTVGLNGTGKGMYFSTADVWSIVR